MSSHRAEGLLRGSLQMRADDPAPAMPADLLDEVQRYLETRRELREMIAIANTAITYGYTAHAQAAVMVIRGIRQRLRWMRKQALTP